MRPEGGIDPEHLLDRGTHFARRLGILFGDESCLGRPLGIAPKENDTVNGTQPGDPAKAAEAMVAIVESPNPPGLLALGQDAFEAFTAVAEAQRTELDTWRELSLCTGI